MLVTMITTIAGPDLSAHPGQKIEVPDELAIALIEGGFATVEKSIVIETTSISPPEKAVLPKPTRKRGK
jgi:hypothetical protein